MVENEVCCTISYVSVPTSSQEVLSLLLTLMVVRLVIRAFFPLMFLCFPTVTEVNRSWHV